MSLCGPSKSGTEAGSRPKARAPASPPALKAALLGFSADDGRCKQDRTFFLARHIRGPPAYASSETSGNIRRFSTEPGAGVPARRGQVGSTGFPRNVLVFGRSTGRFYSENLEPNRKLRVSRSIAVALVNLAAVDLMHEDAASAEGPAAEGRDPVEHRQDRFLLPYALARIAQLRLARSDPRTATELLGAASGQIDRTGRATGPYEEPEFRKSVGMSNGLLTEEEFRSLRERGSRADFAAAVALPRRSLQSRGPGPRLDPADRTVGVAGGGPVSVGRRSTCLLHLSPRFGARCRPWSRSGAPGSRLRALGRWIGGRGRVEILSGG